MSVSRQNHFAFSGLCRNAFDSSSCALNLVQHLTIQSVKKSYRRQLASPVRASCFPPVKWVCFCSLKGLKGMFHWVLVQRPHAGVTRGLILCLMGQLISEEESNRGRAGWTEPPRDLCLQHLWGWEPPRGGHGETLHRGEQTWVLGCSVVAFSGSLY